MLLLLLLSALADLRTDRIPNGFILLGIGFGMAGSILSGRGLSSILASVVLAFLLMYPLYMIGALGAGDVKLFLLVGSFQGTGELMAILAGAFVIGAGFSLIKLAVERNGRERLQYFMSYLQDVRRTGHWKIYGENLKQDYHTYCRNKIHFAVPILFSTVCRIGGLF
ncbi:MAG: A24 family peptidase [Lachnospiraceae bacterium]|nr:A24 family peptidase [Lachnospiraceae bacterium]